ncbi:MAG: DMT family transporter [Chloroflexi bacterium]|nr:DMT family transporter [Chloroflexota bacterium]
MNSPTVNRTVPLLVTALLAVDGLHFVFARALSGILPATTSAMLVTGTASVIMIVYAASQGKLRIQTLRKHLGFFLTIGSLPALSTALSYTAVFYIDPGTASLLQQTAVIYGVLIGVIWLREKLAWRQVIGALVCLVGVGIITFQPGDYLRAGAMLVLVSTFLYALHAAITKRYGGPIDFVEFFLWRVTTMTAFLFIGALAQGIVRGPAEPAGWGLVVFTGTLDVVVSRSLYYLTLRRMPVSVFSLVLTLSPVVAILWSLGLFGIQPTLVQAAGGAAVLIGVAIVTTGRA